jgi:hypothetical protein
MEDPVDPVDVIPAQTNYVLSDEPVVASELDEYSTESDRVRVQVEEASIRGDVAAAAIAIEKLWVALKEENLGWDLSNAIAMAVESDHPEMVKYLLQEGIKINIWAVKAAVYAAATDVLDMFWHVAGISICSSALQHLQHSGKFTSLCSEAYD